MVVNITLVWRKCHIQNPELMLIHLISIDGEEIPLSILDDQVVVI